MPVLLSQRVDQTYRDAGSRFIILIAQQIWRWPNTRGRRSRHPESGARASPPHHDAEGSSIRTDSPGGPGAPSCTVSLDVIHTERFAHPEDLKYRTIALRAYDRPHSTHEAACPQKNGTNTAQSTFLCGCAKSGRGGLNPPRGYFPELGDGDISRSRSAPGGVFLFNRPVNA